MSFTFENINDNPIARVEQRVLNPDFEPCTCFEDELKCNCPPKYFTRSKFLYLDQDFSDDDEEEEEEVDLESLPEATQMLIMNAVKGGADLEEALEVFRTPREESHHIGPDFQLEKNEWIIPIPPQAIADDDSRSERLYVAGKSGLGKSTFLRQYCSEYNKLFPDDNIQIFSRHEGDPVYDKAPFQFEQIALDPELLCTDITLDDLASSLTIFDDCDNLQDKDVSKFAQKLIDDVMSNGRKYSCSSAYVSHKIKGAHKTAGTINEANRIVLFNGGARKHNAEFLKDYIGMEAFTRERALDKKSRWCMINQVGVPYVLREHDAFTFVE